MPSPAILRSKSVPNIEERRHSPSQRSSRSANSPLTAWQKKVGQYIARKTGASHNKSPLTAEKLKEFNRLTAILEEKRYTATSPYYKGLTDSSLVIHRQKIAGTSPGRESHSATSNSSSSRSSFIAKMQDWSRLFALKSKEELISSSSSIWSKSSHGTFTATSSSSSSGLKSTGKIIKKVGSTTIGKELGFDMKEFSSTSKKSDHNTTKLLKGKPLRERVSELQPSPEMPREAKQSESPPETSTESQLPEPGQPSAPLVGPQRLDSPPPERTSKKPRPKKRPPPPPAEKIPNSQLLAPSHQPSLPPTRPLLLTNPPTRLNLFDEKETNMGGKEAKFHWADKYRPSTLKDFLCNRTTALELQSVARSDCCNHFIFVGQPGVGKRTMIQALLCETFGPERVQAREESKVFVLKGEAVDSIQVNIKVSPRHVEINLSEMKGYEKHIIVELIKERKKITDESYPCARDNCRAIILHDADKLSTDSLIYTRWMLDRYKGCYKVFFCCSEVSKLQPILSLCTVIQLHPPTNQEIVEVLEFIANKEGIKLPNQLAAKIANSSKNNLRQAIRSFEATRNFSSSLEEDQEIRTGWEDDITNIARNVVEEQSPMQLYNIRGKLQNLYEHDVSPEFIFKTLLEELKKNLEDKLHEPINILSQKYQRKGKDQDKRHSDPKKRTVQQFMRIEEFIAEFMSCYKSSALKNEEI